MGITLLPQDVSFRLFTTSSSDLIARSSCRFMGYGNGTKAALIRYHKNRTDTTFMTNSQELLAFLSVAVQIGDLLYETTESVWKERL